MLPSSGHLETLTNQNVLWNAKLKKINRKEGKQISVNVTSIIERIYLNYGLLQPGPLHPDASFQS